MGMACGPGCEQPASNATTSKTEGRRGILITQIHKQKSRQKPSSESGVNTSRIGAGFGGTSTSSQPAKNVEMVERKRSRPGNAEACSPLDAWAVRHRSIPREKAAMMVGHAEWRTRSRSCRVSPVRFSCFEGSLDARRALQHDTDPFIS